MARTISAPPRTAIDFSRRRFALASASERVFREGLPRFNRVARRGIKTISRQMLQNASATFKSLKRDGHTAVWIGSEMIIRLGENVLPIALVLSTLQFRDYAVAH